jgi:propionyl-CoA carboxylase alpha chain
MSPVDAPRRDWIVILGDRHHPVTIDLGEHGDAQIAVDGGKAHSLVTSWQPGQHLVEGVLDGKPFAVKFADRTEGYLFRHRGVALRALVCTPFVADLHGRLPEKPKADTSKLVISPMPGLVVSMDVTLGQEVQEGEAVCIVEAMKMQNIIRAGANGTVKAINVKAGESVAADEIMVEFA